jgi:predicted permease
VVDFIINLAPLLGFFVVGIIFKSLKIFGKRDGLVLLRFVFYWFIPALTLQTVMKSEINSELIILPFAPLVPVIMCFLIVLLVLKFFPQPSNAVTGVLFVGSMAMNSGFVMPFINAAYGIEGLSKAILFDLGNLFLIYTFVFYIVVGYGENKNIHTIDMFKKFLGIPTIWAFFIGLAIAYYKPIIPIEVEDFLFYASAPTLPMIMMSLGLAFCPEKSYIPKAIKIIFIRMFCGLAIGLFLAQILPVCEISKRVIVICCASPCSFNTLIFSALEKLEENLAATVVSMSILLGIVMVPMIIMLLG